MKDLQKQLLNLEERINYLLQIKNHPTWGNLDGFKKTCEQFKLSIFNQTEESLQREILKLNESISFLEDRVEEHLSPIERLRIARSSRRFTIKDILKHSYDDYIELGGKDDSNVDPAMICAKATINRLIKNKPYIASVMVIGQDNSHAEKYRNGGSCSPRGNEKALRYMKVAETEGIPIHFYIFSPGARPMEEDLGAAQQIARNIYCMTKLRVPMISLISMGGAEGAEAIGLSDYRIMVSHGYYSAISPERAAAIEGKIAEDSQVPQELIEVCADRLKLTAEANLLMGTVDRIIDEPTLGAKNDDFSFLKKLKTEMILATDKVVMSAKIFSGLRTHEIIRIKHQPKTTDKHHLEVPWELNRDERKRLLALRSEKYLEMGRNGFAGQPEPEEDLQTLIKARTEKVYDTLRYDILKSHRIRAKKPIDSTPGESPVLLQRISEPIAAIIDIFSKKKKEKPQLLLPYTGTAGVEQEENRRADPLELTDTYTTTLSNNDRTISCPNSDKKFCQDIWVPDLYQDFAGVCENCDHHFPLGYQWYLKNVFDPGTISYFNGAIASDNPLDYTGFNQRLQVAQSMTGRRSGNLTFRARVDGIKIVVSMFCSDFRNGTVGCAEGEKFVQACNLARREKRPLLAYVHTTSGIRFQEGTLGVIQMPKCTMAIREYLDSGGLYIVVYDNNSFGGPLSSFLGCSPYQFAIRSSRIGFSGPRDIRESTGTDIPPDYHSAENGLKRGHILGIWDRREFRHNLQKALLTLGNPGLFHP
ncbi:MAG: acetyl-CoA carboxylase carboxyl transferase subunit alpha/beta [Desulforhopalus sp.]